MEVGIAIFCGITLGLIYIYKCVVNAGEDMETFDSISVASKLKKPEGWRIGKLPAEMNQIRQDAPVKRKMILSGKIKKLPQ